MAIALKTRKHASDKSASRARRQVRGRKKVHGSAERPRLVVTRSSRHLFVPVVDDNAGKTLASASSLEKEMRDELRTGADKDAAVAVGKRVAERAVAAGVTEVVFDRGPYLFHGRVKALADAAREGGLQF